MSSPQQQQQQGRNSFSGPGRSPGSPASPGQSPRNSLSGSGVGGGSQRNSLSVLGDDANWPSVLTSSVSLGTFSSNRDSMTGEEMDLVRLLLSLNQKEVFDGWDKKGVNDDRKRKFFAQVKKLDNSYPGGLAAYLYKACDLLEGCRTGANPLDGWTPQVPQGIELGGNPFAPSYVQYEKAGLSELSKTAFVLVAGGLGERLGYSGIKIGLPTEMLTETSYLELYCKQIRAMHKRYCHSSSSSSSSQPPPPPLAIMVSEDTLAGTADMLMENENFGLQVQLLKQEKVASLLDSSGKLAMLDAYTIDTKPHGHGDVHALLHSTGTAADWLARGIKWVVFFQDTNGLAFHSLPAMLGVSKSMQLEVNSLAISRFAKQAVGAITKLKHTDGREMTVNVEYNQLDPLLRATTSPEGDVNDPQTGLSVFPGNINQLVFALEPYVKVLEETDGVMGEFCNPKFANAAKTQFKKPTRLECMMQDYPKVLESGAKVGFTTAPSWLCYSPCKNNAADAAASAAAGVPAGSAWTAESDQYFAKAEMLRLIGCTVPRDPPHSFRGVAAIPGPRIVIDPLTALFPCEMAHVFPFPQKVSLSPSSVLTIEGDVVVESLTLDGALIICAEPGTKIIVRAAAAADGATAVTSDEGDGAGGGGGGVINVGHALKPLVHGQEYSEIDQMRGFTVSRIEEEVVRAVPSASSPSSSSSSSSSSFSPTTPADDEQEEQVEVFIFTGTRLVAQQHYESREEAFGSTLTECCSIFCGTPLMQAPPPPPPK